MARTSGAVALFMMMTAAVTSAQQPAARGQAVYTAQKCAICHSIDGKGNQKGPLDDVGSRLSADDIRSWIVSATEMTAKTKAARKPVMKSYTLPKEDLDALVAYLQSLEKS